MVVVNVVLLVNGWWNNNLKVWFILLKIFNNWGDWCFIFKMAIDGLWLFLRMGKWLL